LAYPEKLFQFDVNKTINTKVKGDIIDW